MILFLFLCWLLSINSVHDLPVATYNMQVSNYEIEIEMEFHQRDLQEALKTKYVHFNEDAVSKYITANTKWMTNGKAQVLQFCSFHMDEYHFIIKAQIDSKETIKTIELFNKCLIHEISDHSNVFYLYQKDKTVRGFRSHKERPTLFIEL